jgi:hypothetical protein
MRTGLKRVISVAMLAASTNTIWLAPPAAADDPKPPSISEVHPPARHQTRGNLEINSSPIVHFPRLYPDFADKGVYHHGHHQH